MIYSCALRVNGVFASFAQKATAHPSATPAPRNTTRHKTTTQKVLRHSTLGRNGPGSASHSPPQQVTRTHTTSTTVFHSNSSQRQQGSRAVPQPLQACERPGASTAAQTNALTPPHVPLLCPSAPPPPPIPSPTVFPTHTKNTSVTRRKRATPALPSPPHLSLLSTSLSTNGSASHAFSARCTGWQCSHYTRGSGSPAGCDYDNASRPPTTPSPSPDG